MKHYVASESDSAKVIDCPVCGRGAAHEVKGLKGHRSGEVWPARFCRACHSLTIGSDYREDEETLRKDLAWNIRKIDRNREYSRGLLRDLLELRPETKGVLEIGCGVGTFLATARDEFSLAVEGFDINAEAVAWGNERYGLEMQAAEWSGATPGEADLIVSLSCLEHVANPRPLLSEMASYAKRRGAAIYISVPFFSQKHWGYLEEGREDEEGSPFFDNDVHVTLFSKIGLAEAMAEFGLPVFRPLGRAGWSGILFEAEPSVPNEEAGDEALRRSRARLAKWRESSLAAFAGEGLPACLAPLSEEALAEAPSASHSAVRGSGSRQSGAGWVGWLRRLLRRTR